MQARHLETDRLLLRPPETRDIAAMLPLIGDYEVAKNLSRVPHPYGEEDARSFIARAAQANTQEEGFSFALTRRGDGRFMGCCGIHRRDAEFELGYWLGQPYWSQGFATEAAGELLRIAFEELNVARLVAGWFHDNPASGRVLEKLGFTASGAEQRDCLARGHTVYCHLMTLDRRRP